VLLKTITLQLGDASQNIVEFLADGFKLTTTNAATNVSGGTYIYAAFADRPGNNWTPNNLSAGIDLNPTAKQNFDAVLYTGNSGTQSISSLNFAPGLVWIKNRDDTDEHMLFDTTRGPLNRICSSVTNTEASQANTLTAFGTNGFTLGSDGQVNQNTQKYVAWCWKAGGAAVSNTDGSINSSVSVNAAYGFSVTKYVGTGSLATVGHGLGNSVPKFMLIKGLDDPLSWAVYADSPSNYLQLSDLGASNSTDASNAWNGTAPTSSVFTVKSKAR